MRLVDYLSTNRIFIDLKAGPKEEILHQIVRQVVEKGEIPPEKSEIFFQKLMERESLKSTGIGHGVAVPHAIIEDIGKSFVSLSLCQEGTDFDSIDHKMVHIVITLVGPLRDRPIHLKLLACIARLMIIPEIPQQILQAHSPADVYCLLLEKEGCGD